MPGKPPPVPRSITFIPGNILKATLKAKVSGAIDGDRPTCWGVGYNDSEWLPSMTWNNNSNKSITLLDGGKWTTTNSENTFEDKEFNITGAFTNDDDKIVTLLVYETEAGSGYFKEPYVEIQYEPTVKEKLSFAHLNAIKRAYDGLSGTISSITLAKKSNTDVRYLHHARGDGWQVLQWPPEVGQNLSGPLHFCNASAVSVRFRNTTMRKWITEELQK